MKLVAVVPGWNRTYLTGPSPWRSAKVTPSRSFNLPVTNMGCR